MNPLMSIMVQMMKGEENPQVMLHQIMENNQIMSNPMAKNVIEMFQKGDIDGMQKMAENLAKERGTTIDDVKNSIMQQFGIK